MHLLVVEEDRKVISSAQIAIIESLTHNVRPFAAIENVVTHIGYRNKGYASALLEKASDLYFLGGFYETYISYRRNYIC